LLPPPTAVLASGALAGKLAAVWAGLRRAAVMARHPLAETGLGGGGAAAAGGGAAGVGMLKVGLAAVCVAGAAGGLAVCARFGVLPSVGLPLPAARAQAVHHAAEHRRPRVTVSFQVTPSRNAVAVVAPAIAPRRSDHPGRVSAITQIRREFGGASVHAASTPSAAPAVAQPASANGRPPTRADSAKLNQTQAEFGFEK
jgi:hypothetical protein